LVEKLSRPRLKPGALRETKFRGSIYLRKHLRSRHPFCLVASYWEPGRIADCKQHSDLGSHVHVGFRDLYGSLLAGALKEIPAESFLGDGLLHRRFVEWILYPKVLRVRRDSAAAWQRLDRLISSGRRDWAIAFLADISHGRHVQFANHPPAQGFHDRPHGASAQDCE